MGFTHDVVLEVFVSKPIQRQSDPPRRARAVRPPRLDRSYQGKNYIKLPPFSARSCAVSHVILGDFFSNFQHYRNDPKVWSSRALSPSRVAQGGLERSRKGGSQEAPAKKKKPEEKRGGGVKSTAHTKGLGNVEEGRNAEAAQPKKKRQRKRPTLGTQYKTLN